MDAYLEMESKLKFSMNSIDKEQYFKFSFTYLVLGVKPHHINWLNDLKLDIVSKDSQL